MKDKLDALEVTTELLVGWESELRERIDTLEVVVKEENKENEDAFRRVGREVDAIKEARRRRSEEKRGGGRRRRKEEGKERKKEENFGGERARGGEFRRGSAGADLSSFCSSSFLSLSLSLSLSSVSFFSFSLLHSLHFHCSLSLADFWPDKYWTLCFGRAANAELACLSSWKTTSHKAPIAHTSSPSLASVSMPTIPTERSF